MQNDDSFLFIILRKQTTAIIAIKILICLKGNTTKKILQILYVGCLLYFGIREQKQILIIKNRFIVFQNIPH